MHSSGRGPLHLCVSALWLGETSTKRQVSTKRPEKKKPLVEEALWLWLPVPTNTSHPRLKCPCSSPHRWLPTPRPVLALSHSEITELLSRVEGIRNPLVSPIP